MHYTRLSICLLVTISFAHSSFDDDWHSWSDSIAQTMHLANTRSLAPLKAQEAIPKMLDTFLHYHDKHARFLGPKDHQELIKSTNGEFYGIGVTLAPKKQEDDFVLILDTIVGSPAQKKGLQRFDKIIAIDNKPVSSLSVEDIIGSLKGEKRYSAVHLAVVRDKSLLNYSLERDRIKEQHMSAYYLPEHGFAYCSLTLFTQQTARELEQYLRKLSTKELKGIILDVRDNAGGVLQAAVDCAGLFLRTNTLVVHTKDKHDQHLEEFYTARPPLYNLHVPVCILVNNYTASAAEILAGALRIHAQTPGRRSPALPSAVFLVGTKTHGKGSVQEIIPLKNKCALKVTTCLYCLPNGVSVDGVGLEPDFTIEQKFPPTAEMALLNNLYGQEKGPSAPAVASPQAKKSTDPRLEKLKLLQQDYQVQSAIHLLSLLLLGKQHCPSECLGHERACRWLKKHYITQDKVELQEL